MFSHSQGDFELQKGILLLSIKPERFGQEKPQSAVAVEGNARFTFAQEGSDGTDRP
jgi:hypothetical protein